MRWKTACALLSLFAASVIVLPAQILTTLANFNTTDGSLYGTTEHGGNSTACTPPCGVIFKITPGEALTVVHSFDFTDGAYSVAGLVQAANGYLYGTTQFSADGNGTIFKITPAGALSTIHAFVGTDGSTPHAGLVQAANGDLFGTTTYGGTSTACGTRGCGTIFKITPDGVFTTLHNFQSTDGANPFGLVQAANGDLYGTTNFGGNTTCYSAGCGTVFKITPAGVFTALHNFLQNQTDGTFPSAGLVQAADGNLYGTTSEGGAYLGGCGAPISGDLCGTIFEITPAGMLTTIHSFEMSDGESPNGLVQATDGNLYGTTYEGGGSNFCSEGCGTIFKISLDGAFTTLYNSFGSTLGYLPEAGLLLATDGNFYGTTNEGPYGSIGGYGYGTVFRFSVGLGPFVKTLPALGLVGSIVRILGTDLTGATSVTFNGIAAGFIVVSPAQILARVPFGATTGKVQVITPSGTLLSNVGFVVL